MQAEQRLEGYIYIYIYIHIYIYIYIILYIYLSNSLYCSLNLSRVSAFFFGGKVENIHILWLFINAD